MITGANNRPISAGRHHNLCTSEQQQDALPDDLIYTRMDEIFPPLAASSSTSVPNAYARNVNTKIKYN